MWLIFEPEKFCGLSRKKWQNLQKYQTNLQTTQKDRQEYLFFMIVFLLKTRKHTEYQIWKTVLILTENQKKEKPQTTKELYLTTTHNNQKTKWPNQQKQKFNASALL